MVEQTRLIPPGEIPIKIENTDDDIYGLEGSFPNTTLYDRHQTIHEVHDLVENAVGRWKNGEIELAGQAIREAAHVFARGYDVVPGDIKSAKKELKKVRITDPSVVPQSVAEYLGPHADAANAEQIAREGHIESTITRGLVAMVDHDIEQTPGGSRDFPTSIARVAQGILFPYIKDMDKADDLNRKGPIGLHENLVLDGGVCAQMNAVFASLASHWLRSKHMSDQYSVLYVGIKSQDVAPYDKPYGKGHVLSMIAPNMRTVDSGNVELRVPDFAQGVWLVDMTNPALTATEEGRVLFGNPNTIVHTYAGRWKDHFAKLTVKTLGPEKKEVLTIPTQFASEQSESK